MTGWFGDLDYDKEGLRHTMDRKHNSGANVMHTNIQGTVIECKENHR